MHTNIPINLRPVFDFEAFPNICLSSVQNTLNALFSASFLIILYHRYYIKYFAVQSFQYIKAYRMIFVKKA